MQAVSLLPAHRDSSTFRRPFQTHVNEKMAKSLARHKVRCLFVCFIAASLLLQFGCAGFLSQMNYMIKGHDVEPAYDGLNGKRVAVVCVSDNSAYGPDTLTYVVAQAVGIRLANGLKNGGQVIAPARIEEWMDSNDWNETEYVELGKGVDADMVVAIEIASYSLTEGSTLFKGKADVTVTVYDIDKDGQVPYSATPQHFVFPKHGRPAIQTTEREFEAFYLSQLTTMIADHFLVHSRLESVARDAATIN